VLTVEGSVGGGGVCRYARWKPFADLTNGTNKGASLSTFGSAPLYAGKTTALKAISGLLAPAAGRITFRGEGHHAGRARHILQLGHSALASPDDAAFFPYMTVAENFEIGLYLRSERPGHRFADLEAIYARFPSCIAGAPIVRHTFGC